MTSLAQNLQERTSEFANHMQFAKALDQHLFEGGPLIAGDTSLSATHLLSIKSGLIVHLYNLVESIMMRTIESIGRDVLVEQPAKWSENTLREWLRFNAAMSIEGSEESRLNTVQKAALKLLSKNPIENVKFKKPSGTWSDKVIYSFSQRLNVEFVLTPEIAQKISPSPLYSDKTPLTFLADRRNAIAHGRRTFEQGASDLSLIEIQQLADVTIEYMEHTVAAFQKFIDDKTFLETDN